jgi:HD superfamily phosphodiesterase
MADWLTQLKTGLKDITLPLARQYWPGISPEDEPYYNYRYQHVEQVDRDARKLLAAHGGDEDIVLASVWIHDRYKPQFEGENHAARAAAWANENLVKLGFPKEKLPAVVYAVGNHAVFGGKISPEHKEAQILWDADKLGKIGAIMVVYILCAGGAFPQTKINFLWLTRELHTWKERNKNLVNDFHLPLSRELGQKRYTTLKAFSDALDEETG